MLTSVSLLVISKLTIYLPYTACYDCENPNLPIEHGFYVIKNEQPQSRNDDYAIGTTPPGFSVRMSSIPNAGLGVFAETTIPANTRLGPYHGIIYKELTKEDQSYVWTSYYTADFNDDFRYIDGVSKSHSSWIRYINMANTIDQENLYVHQYNYEIYYVTYECIKPGTELLIWYGDDYGAAYGLERTDKDYQKRFPTSPEILYLDTVPSEKVVQYSSTCYKFNRQCPFKKPPNRNGNFTKTCLFGAYYDFCKYTACDINPCTGVADCGYCKEYCYYTGKYFRPNQEFDHTDNVNVCVCTNNLEVHCSEDWSTYIDMCFY